MLSATIVSLKILTGTFCCCLSCGKVLIMARGKELNNLQKALIVKLWKVGKSYRNISCNMNIPFIMISSFIARFKRCNNWKQKRTGAPRKISARNLGRLINQNPLVTHEELQEDLHSSGYSVTKRTISNEMLRNGL